MLKNSDKEKVWQTIAVLNEALELDQEAVQKLIDYRVPCNDDLADHETIQVLANEDGSNTRVGLLGIINGILGKDEDSGWGYVAAEYRDEKLVGFLLAPSVETENDY